MEGGREGESEEGKQDGLGIIKLVQVVRKHRLLLVRVEVRVPPPHHAVLVHDALEHLHDRARNIR